MIFPNRLTLGDTVGIVAPSSPVTPKRAQQCKEYIESIGYTVLMGQSATSSSHGYLAGEDSLRANDINEMFANPSVKAIFCIRGGYGGNRLMRLLDYDVIRSNPKIFVGYSDITSFHLAFHSLCNLVTFHGPMVSSNMLDHFDDYTNHSFFKALNLNTALQLCNPSGNDMGVIHDGCACGEIIGGCLSLVSPAIGTFYQPDFRNKILFLEDVDESLPRCDKMIEHLFHAGIIDQVSGIILGEFLDCNNSYDPSYTIIDYFKDRFAHIGKPVMYNIKSGHGHPMATIPFGTLCRMNTFNRCISFKR
ncbi:MAG: LD-carboxypeptidase [Clostridiales bacterium]|nr:LD-carboxypeptidase [Clostridiales bacterium]